MWEANHVWLIFTFVVLWTCFPRRRPSGWPLVAMFVPLTLAALGIRRAAPRCRFCFSRSGVSRTRLRRRSGSRASPSLGFCRTCTVWALWREGSAPDGCPAGGRTDDAVRSWRDPTSIVAGLLAVSVDGVRRRGPSHVGNIGNSATNAVAGCFFIRAVAGGGGGRSRCPCRTFIMHSDASYLLRRTHLSRPASGRGFRC